MPVIGDSVHETDRCIKEEPAEQHAQRSHENVDYGVEFPGQGKVECRLSHIVILYSLLVG